MSNNNEIILRIRKVLLKKRMTQRDLAASVKYEHLKTIPK